MRVLLLEDDYYSNTVIANELVQLGFFIDQCYDGESAMDIIYNQQHDFYILDINVPHFDGYEVLEYIREHHPIAPVIMISTNMDIEYLKRAFLMGCHDYMKKPFELEELILRIKNILRLSNRDLNTDIVNLSQGYTYSLSSSELFYHGISVELTRIESLLLRVLINNLGNVVNNDVIKYYVWENEEIAPATMRYWIHRLIKKLKNGMIVNTRGVGYRLRKLDRSE
ncbi:MAG: response regulator transcription factor [Sulfuricurvum sp.]|nr:response regulator transcription factor [Sulfuricurvum sp.]